METTEVRQMRTVVSVKSLIWEISSGCRELRVGMHPWAHRLRVI